MNKAVFLDRDGVITKENFRITNPEDVEILDYTDECIGKLHSLGFLVIVVTNQSGVARGLFTEDELIRLNELLIKEIDVDDVLYCPHHPDGIVEKYAKKCECRKPGTGMIEAATVKYNIDLSKSFLVGDRESDIEAGRKAGVKTVLVESGYGKSIHSVKADYYCKDLRDWVNQMVTQP